VLGELINRSAAGARSAPKRGGAFLVSAVAASESSKAGHSSKLPKSSAAPKICDDAGEDVRGWAAPTRSSLNFLECVSQLLIMPSSNFWHLGCGRICELGWSDEAIELREITPVVKHGY
jgi:hypothetical protein